ncbi:hypothetical protein K505DRAFT_362777 [Melanomma pulvis-pyrius CBS 109.77]|uniref:Thioesterase domain-containing protein n=1 Tax=Melanomma pulvis-pyrius CBS 109.77 TaxID=1314802 RepID=A0A6A6X9I1_9PLEO|nr:hypothetical protein K505DRAFT_362777 [Melanomma pulvis-pyrius CBS 109.77]
MTDAISHFSQVPWCAALIEDLAWTPTRTASRVPKPTTEDSFFAETLGTDRTIRQCLTLRPTVPERDAPDYREVRTIVDLGTGLNGHPNICHGGFVATMLDEVFGVLITLNLAKKMEKPRMEGSQLNAFTAYLNTNYKKPVPTPGVLLITASFVKQERNKIYVSGTVEDGNGTIFSTAEGMFIETKTKL